MTILKRELFKNYRASLAESPNIANIKFAMFGDFVFFGFEVSLAEPHLWSSIFAEYASVIDIVGSYIY